MEREDKIRRISRDFREANGPFANVTFPEKRLLDETTDGDASMETRATLVSAFATFDYNRDANQLVDNLIELYERAPNHFQAECISDESQLSDVFSDIGFRYPNRDASAWFENNCILRDRYHGSWLELIASTGCQAHKLVERVRVDDFKCIKGDKIAPMYARIVNDFVCPLRALYKLQIPVDTHVERLSKILFDMPDANKDEIRNAWTLESMNEGIKLTEIDGALWHIGSNWDEWGEEYWNSV